MRLITKSDIAKYRQISKSVKEVTINQFIDDAQIMDLSPLLGDAFYFDILSNVNKYASILDEKEYIYEGVKMVSPGLKKALCLFAYARYILHGTQTDTPFGYVEKQYNDGVQVARVSRKEVYKLSQQTAMQYWYQVEKYITRNASEFPLWNLSCGTKKRTFRFTTIKK